jgi:lactoylglutathione lyase
MKRLISSYLLTLIFAALFGRQAAAQGPAAMNHVALYVVDLPKSTAFYKNVLQLQQIPEPFHDGRHVWFRMGPHSQLHIIQGAAKVEEHDINTHMAFSVKDLPAFLKHLDKQAVRYGSFKGEEKQTTPRIDGVQQVYLQDPDNFWIEINNDKY